MSASRLTRQPRRSPVAVVIALLVAACGGGGSTAADLPSSAPSIGRVGDGRSGRRRRRAAESLAPTKLVVGLGYIPSVQFAQFYLAQQQRLLRATPGSTSSSRTRSTRTSSRSSGRARSTSGSATGRASSRPPATASRSSTSRRSTASSRTSCSPRPRPGSRPRPTSRARRSARPGSYGSGWIMLQALLASAGLTTDDVEIVEYPDFTPGDRGRAGRRRRRDRVRQQRAGPARAARRDAGRPARSTTSRRCPGPGLIASTSDHRGQARRDRRRSSRRRSRRWTRSRPTRPSGSTPRSRPSPSWPRPRDAQAAILAATIASWTGPVQDGARARRDRPRRLDGVDRVLGTLGLVKNPVTTDDARARRTSCRRATDEAPGRPRGRSGDRRIRVG